MTLNKYILSITIAILMLEGCVTINHNTSINISSVPQVNLLKSEIFLQKLSPYFLNNNSLDLHILNSKKSWLLNLHLKTSSNPDEVLLTGIAKNLQNTDSSFVNFYIPQQVFNDIEVYQKGPDLVFKASKNEAGKNNQLPPDFMPTFISNIDSNKTSYGVRTYSALIKDENNDYYFSAVTDPIPLLIIIGVAIAGAYKYEKCKGVAEAHLKECQKNKKIPDCEFHFFGDCAFRGCK